MNIRISSNGYIEALKKSEYGALSFLPIYYKISNQSDYSGVDTAGYKCFHRTDIIALLQKGNEQGIEDSIFYNYYQHLLSVEENHESYKTKPLQDWTGLSWKGFYSELQKWGMGVEWDYVANPRGGFVGF